jgi:hypothetical protein
MTDLPDLSDEALDKIEAAYEALHDAHCNASRKAPRTPGRNGCSCTETTTLRQLVAMARRARVQDPTTLALLDRHARSYASKVPLAPFTKGALTEETIRLRRDIEVALAAAYAAGARRLAPPGGCPCLLCKGVVCGNKREETTPFEAFSPSYSSPVEAPIQLADGTRFVRICPACPNEVRAVREPCENCGHSCEHTCDKVIEINETSN